VDAHPLGRSRRHAYVVVITEVDYFQSRIVMRLESPNDDRGAH
jgi:hypothetical protein